MSQLSDPQHHDDLLNYRLKRLLTMAAAPAIRLCEGGSGVSRLEWRLAAALVEEGPMSPTALAERAHVERGRVSHTLTKLVDKALVQREEMPQNRRRATVAATDAGQKLYRELWPQLAAINRRVVAALEEHETVALEDYLRRLTDRAQQIYDEGGGVDVRTDRRLGGSRRFWPR